MIETLVELELSITPETMMATCPNPECFEGSIFNSPFDPVPVVECPVCRGAGRVEVVVPDWQRDWELEPVWAY